MTDFDRRALLKFALGGVAAAAAGTVLSAGNAFAAPLPVETASGLGVENPVEEARTTCWWHRGRRVCRRRPVRRVCWWNRGRRVCAWR